EEECAGHLRNATAQAVLPLLPRVRSRPSRARTNRPVAAIPVVAPVPTGPRTSARLSLWRRIVRHESSRDLGRIAPRLEGRAIPPARPEPSAISPVPAP